MRAVTDEGIPYGTLGVLDYDPVEDTLLCHLCGGRYRSLAQHVRLKHGLPAAEYRALTGLNRQTRLVSKGMRERLAAVTAPLIERLRSEGKLKRWDEDPERFRRAKAAATEVIHHGLRPEGLRHRREAQTEADRRARADRRRERNLAGLDRASPSAIGAGVKRHYREYPEYAQANAERMRELGKHLRVTDKTARDVICPRCEKEFRAMSHRDKYCLPCRPEVAREYQRDWKRRLRQRREG